MFGEPVRTGALCRFLSGVLLSKRWRLFKMGFCSLSLVSIKDVLLHLLSILNVKGYVLL